MVGAGTLRHEGYRAVRLDEQRRAWRREQGLAEYPTLVVVSAALDLDPDAPRLRRGAGTADRAHARRRARRTGATASAAVADVVVCGESVVDLAVGLAELRARGLDQVLCEGGPHLFGALLAADLVDELCLTVSPLLAGPGAGRIVAGPAPAGAHRRCASATAHRGRRHPAHPLRPRLTAQRLQGDPVRAPGDNKVPLHAPASVRNARM